ncbi:MAG: hypothetical protein ACFFBD_04750 [Candidatus Hodarchaeota archaeon]
MKKTFVKILGPNLNDAISTLEKLALKLEVDKVLPVEKGMVLSKERSIEYDFIFSWQKEPNLELIVELAHRIDEALLDTKARYTLQTEFSPPTGKEPPVPAQSFIKIYGPPIGTAVDRLLNLLDKIPEVEAERLTGVSPAVGQYDFAFAWKEPPSQEIIRDLVKELDKVFTEINCMYSFYTVHNVQRIFRKETDVARLKKLMTLEQRMRSLGVVGNR